MKKKFEKQDMYIMQNLIGKKLVDIFKQLDMFIINFGDGIEYSLHTFSFLRFRNEDEILLTSNDEYYTANYKNVSEKVYKKDEAHRKSLLRHTLEKVKTNLKDAVVSGVSILNTGDIYIEFDNGTIIENLIDRKSENFEYYRFIKYDPNYYPSYVDGISKKNTHVVVNFVDGLVTSEVQE